MTGAFRGDAAVKRDLRARVSGHLAAGTLRFDQTCWDGASGSPLGVSVQGTDADTYAEAFGYPLPLAALLDPLTLMIQQAEQREAFVLGWIDQVAVGSDLSRVPAQVMLHMLETTDVDAAVEPLKARVIAMHQRELRDGAVTRAEWRVLRQAIAGDHQLDENDHALQASLALLDAASWPAGRGHTPLTSTFDRCGDIANLKHDPEWSEADEIERNRFFAAMEKELQPRLEAGEDLDFMAIFMERDPDLMQRTEAYNDRFQAQIGRRAQTLADICLAYFGQASGG